MNDLGGVLQFGEIDRFMLFGGGQLLFEQSSKLVKTQDVYVVTSRRHALSGISTNEGELTLLEGLSAIQVPCIVTANVNDDQSVTELITATTLGLSLGAEWIFRESFILKFAGKLVNFHGSLLPKYRGGGGYTWLVLRGERQSGSSIHLVDTCIDTGSIVISREYVFPKWCRKPVDFQQIAFTENAALLEVFLRDVAAGCEFDLTIQQHAVSTYWPRLNTERQGFIDWRWSLVEIERFVCAFDDPYPGASSYVNGQRVYLKDCTIDLCDGTFHPFQTGLVYRKTSNLLHIATGDGGLVVGELLNEVGGNAIGAVRLGDRFYTPTEVLERARQARAVCKAEALPDV